MGSASQVAGNNSTAEYPFTVVRLAPLKSAVFPTRELLPSLRIQDSKPKLERRNKVGGEEMPKDGMKLRTAQLKGSEGIGRKVKQSKEKSEKNNLLLSNTFGITGIIKQTRSMHD